MRPMESPHTKAPASKFDGSFIPPSKRLLDPLPSAPTPSSPRQRIIGKIDRSSLTMYLQIMASSDYVLPNSATDTDVISPETVHIKPPSKKVRPRKLGDRILPHIAREGASPLEALAQEDTSPLEESPFHRALNLGISEVVRDALMKRELSLADFRPLKAPFVPYIIKVLVNSIEAESNRQGWDILFTTISPYQRRVGESHACLLIQNWNHHHHVKRQVKVLPLPLQIATLRVLLAGFKEKPLHFSKRVLKEVIKRPLFDLFLRPSPNIKSLVRQTALPCNRTTMDTLAFLMFHLQHMWEHGSNPITTKTILAKLYGPLLVSFSERPVIIDQDPTDYKTEEAAIMEVVLEVCNSQFWDNLSMLQIHLAFDSAKHDEEENMHSTDEADMRTTTEASDYENEAWFSCLFAPDFSGPQSLPVQKPEPLVMPWSSSISTDCRAKPRKARPVVETPEQRVERAKQAVAKFLGCGVRDWKPPPFHADLRCRRLSHLEGMQLHHVYLQCRLRPTEAILRDVAREALLPPRKAGLDFSAVSARVQDRLISPPTPPLPPALTAIESGGNL